jgi:hypothetical protein
MLQTGWCITWGLYIYQGINNDPDCFMSLGAYSVCSATARISIYSSLFFLMGQAFMKRVLLPGVSIFVDASVCCSPHCIHQFRITTLQPKYHQTERAQKCKSVLYAPQILDSQRQPHAENDDAEQPSDL